MLCLGKILTSINGKLNRVAVTILYKIEFIALLTSILSQKYLHHSKLYKHNEHYTLISTITSV